MKWFKHPSDLRDDDRVADFLDRSRDRHAYYSVFIVLCEHIARSMNASHPLPTRALSVASWCRACDVPVNRWAAICEHLTSSGLAEIEQVDGKQMITVPLLSDWMDESTTKLLRRSGTATEEIRPEKSESRRDKKRIDESEMREEKSLSSSDESSPVADPSQTPWNTLDLPGKVDNLLNTASPMIFRDGRMDIAMLAKTINSRDGTPGEPSPKFYNSVRNCAEAWARNNPTPKPIGSTKL